MDAGRHSSNIFPMPQIQALLYPPPPLPSSYSLSSSSSSRHAPSITSFPILVLTVLGVLTTSVLLLAYYVFIIRCCLKWHQSSPSDATGLIGRRRRRHHATSGTSSSLPVPGGAPAEAHGLEEAIIQALPAFRYRKAFKNASATADSGASPTSECAVCLGEFEDEERVRMLPACLHVFHVDCIDTWLQSNANCPLCRAAISDHCLLPPLEHLPRPEPDEVVIQVSRTAEEEATQAQHQQARLAVASYEPAGDTTAYQQVSSDKRKNSNAWRDIDISSKADECNVGRKDRDVLPLRRSFSTGEMAGGEVHLQIHNILQRNTHLDDGDSSRS